MAFTSHPTTGQTVSSTEFAEHMAKRDALASRVHEGFGASYVGLNMTIQPGFSIINGKDVGDPTTDSSEVVVLTDNDTNHVWLQRDGNVVANTTGVAPTADPLNSLKIYVVVTSSGAVQTETDLRDDEVYFQKSLRGEKLFSNSGADMGGAKIENVADPVTDQDAATKAYVDANAGGGGGGGSSLALPTIQQIRPAADLSTTGSVYCGGIVKHGTDMYMVFHDTGDGNLFLAKEDASGNWVRQAGNLGTITTFASNGARIASDGTYIHVFVRDTGANPDVIRYARTTDGASWVDSQDLPFGNPGGSNLTAMDADISPGGDIYVVVGQSASNGTRICRSQDAGVSWAEVYTDTTNRGTLQIIANSNTEVHLVTFTSQSFGLSSTDSAATFGTPLLLANTGVTAFSNKSDGRVYYVENSTGLRTIDYTDDLFVSTTVDRTIGQGQPQNWVTPDKETVVYETENNSFASPSPSLTKWTAGQADTRQTYLSYYSWGNASVMFAELDDDDNIIYLFTSALISTGTHFLKRVPY